MGQQLAQQQRMMGAEAALQCLPQRRQLGPQATLGQFGQHGRVVGSRDQRVQHRPAGHAQHVAGDRAQLDPGVLQDLLQPLGFPGSLLDQRLAVAGQIAQLPDRLGSHERGSDQAVLDQLADPHRVGHVGLAPGHVAQVGGVEQPALEVVFQQVVHRPPVHPGGLHPDHGHTEAGQPVAQQHEPRGRGPKRPGLGLASALVARHSHRRGDRCLVHVQSGAAFDQPLHRCLLHARHQRCRPEEPDDQESQVRAHSNSSGCPRLPRPTYQRARPHQDEPTSPGRPTYFHPSGVAAGHEPLTMDRQPSAVLSGVLAGRTAP